MRGPYGAGSAAALHELGLGDVFDVVVGVSTGAPTAAYFLAGQDQVRLGSSLYYEECTSNAFMNPWRFKKLVDIDQLITWMKRGPKALNTQAIRRHPSQFFVSAITRKGHMELFDAKTAQPGMLEAIRASIAIPGLFGSWVPVNNTYYCDGGFDDPLPMSKVITMFHPTDVLVLPNQAFEIAKNYHPGFGDYVAGLLTLRQLGPRKSWDIVQRKTTFRTTFESRPHPNIRIAFLWPPNAGLHEGTKNAKKLKKAFEDTRQKTLEWFHQRM